jgi:hypothetical protein
MAYGEPDLFAVFFFLAENDINVGGVIPRDKEAAHGHLGWCHAKGGFKANGFALGGSP